MAKRLFDHDPTTGISEWFDYDELSNTFSLTTTQDVSKLVEENKQAYQNVTSLDRWGDGRVVARIPLSIYTQWIQDGRDKDDAFLRRWLNDPENKHFRVRPGKV